MSHEEVFAALMALKEADRDRAAGPQAEARLLEAFRRQRARRLWKRVTWGTPAAAAAVVFILVARTRPVPDPPPQPAPVLAAAPVPAPGQEAAVQRPARRPDGPREVVTEFFSLLDVQPPFEHGELVRVTVRAEAMQTVGLAVSADHLDDPVAAEVVVGQEGLARAIRFVSFQQ